MASVCIVEDNSSFRDGLDFLIKASNKYKVLGAYSSAEEALMYVFISKPNIVLMDIDLPGMNGVECTKEIKKRLPNTEIIMITAFEDSERVFNALCAGATGYITKNSDIKDILSALDEVVDGGAPMSSSIARMVVSRFNKNNGTNPLNEMETKILHLLSEGKSYKTAALVMKTGIDNVKYYIKNIYFKLQVNNKEDAIEKAKSNNWI